LQIAPDVSAVLIEQREQFSQLSFIHLRRSQKQLERREQVHRPQRYFHGAIPVHASPDGILLPPACELPKKFSAESLIISYCVGAPQRDELGQSIQLPNHAHV